jgi:hypothetical protein
VGSHPIGLASPGSSSAGLGGEPTEGRVQNQREALTSSAGAVAASVPPSPPYLPSTATANRADQVEMQRLIGLSLAMLARLDARNEADHRRSSENRLRARPSSATRALLRKNFSLPLGQRPGRNYERSVLAPRLVYLPRVLAQLLALGRRWYDSRKSRSR